MAAKKKRKKKKQSGDALWYWVICFCLLIVVGAGWASINLTAKNKIDKATLCHITGPKSAIVILLDLTDPLGRTQALRLRGIINDTIAASPVDTMISLGVVSEDPSNWGVKFAKCKPATGEEANALYQNPRQIAEVFEAEFLQPMGGVIGETMGGAVENRSPIMEALQSLIAETPSFTDLVGPKQILLVSDMLQHSDTLSFYRGQGWDYFRTTGKADRLAYNLAGVEVTIIRIPRETANVDLTLVEDFWARYFDKQGSSPPSEQILGDL